MASNLTKLFAAKKTMKNMNMNINMCLRRVFNLNIINQLYDPFNLILQIVNHDKSDHENDHEDGMRHSKCGLSLTE